MRLKSKDIAKALNVSPSAVSLALNDRPGISEEMRSRVKAYVEEFYANGKFLDNGESAVEIRGSIALVIHRTVKRLLILPSIWFETTIDQMQRAAIENEYKLEITYFNQEMNRDTFMEGLNDERIAGVIVFATEMAREELEIYRDIKKPLVIMDARFPIEDINTVTLNNRNAVARAVEYAYDMGHRKIGFLKSKVLINNFVDRFWGYKEGLFNVGLPYDERYVFELGATADTACADFLKVLDRPDLELPTIFLSDLDYVVAGAMRALKTKGYKIPEDISLIGFDDVELCSELVPPLTSLHIKPDIGPVAVGRLVDLINKKNEACLNVEVGTKLVVRDSVKTIKSI